MTGPTSSWPKTGSPLGDQPIVEPFLDGDEIIDAIEHRGIRLAWARAQVCPCADSTEGRTERAGLQCPRCKGIGRFWFGPRDYEVPAGLDPVQKRIMARSASGSSALIAGVISQATNAQDFYGSLGHWMRGDMFVSVRPENLVGYFDRLTAIDAEMVYSQIIVLTAAQAAARRVELRYPATSITAVHTVTADLDFDRSDDGDLLLASRLATGSRFTVHYALHPSWIVDEMPHVLRASSRELGVVQAAQAISAKTKLEFLLPPA